MQFEKLVTDKIISNQNANDGPTGIRIKMNNNIIWEDKYKYVLIN